jgi:light-regulated signal transduction histidine kinase (bacteriophytochrome)
LLENSEPVLFFEKEVLYNDKLHKVGIGNHAVARLWNGEKIIGIYAVDNLIHQNPITSEDLEILDIYGTAMGHLFTLKLAEEALEKAYAEVEKRVEERTAQLEVANSELEAFVYSVSHDLRTPLRAIDRYTNIIVEDYEQLLDEEGKRKCAIICNETKHMGQLIDDLLSFSYISHAEMQVSPIDMEALASSVFHELTTPESRERIDFRVASLPLAIGDPTLMHQLWTNLLSNAVKFSSKRERAVIEVGYQQDGQRIIYSVRDNGAGFDMQHAEKLFKVFWRFHSKNEFDGTGVGLAIVQRLIQRHGGKVWAESHVDQGATFYFTVS